MRMRMIVSISSTFQQCWWLRSTERRRAMRVEKKWMMMGMMSVGVMRMKVMRIKKIMGEDQYIPADFHPFYRLTPPWNVRTAPWNTSGDCFRKQTRREITRERKLDLIEVKVELYWLDGVHSERLLFKFCFKEIFKTLWWTSDTAQ